METVTVDLMTRSDLSLALERAGAAYGAYELSARRTRSLWRWFKYGGSLLVAAVVVLSWLHFQDVGVNNSLEHRLTAMSAIQDPVAPALDRLTMQMSALQTPPIVVQVDPSLAPSTTATVPPTASAEDGESPPPAPADAVPPTPEPSVSTPTVIPVPVPAPAVKAQQATDGCLLNLLCVQNLLG